MSPKSIIPVNSDNLPLALKYNNKIYIVKSTSNGSLHMSRENDKDRPLSPTPPPPVTEEINIKIS